MKMASGKQPAAGPLARAISAEVRAIMARQRMSRATLATRAGMSEGYLGKRLRDQASLTINDIEAIVAALGGNVAEFRRAAAQVMDDAMGEE